MPGNPLINLPLIAVGYSKPRVMREFFPTLSSQVSPPTEARHAHFAHSNPLQFSRISPALPFQVELAKSGMLVLRVMEHHTVLTLPPEEAKPTARPPRRPTSARARATTMFGGAPPVDKSQEEGDHLVELLTQRLPWLGSHDVRDALVVQRLLDFLRGSPTDPELMRGLALSAHVAARLRPAGAGRVQLGLFEWLREKGLQLEWGDEKRDPQVPFSVMKPLGWNLNTGLSSTVTTPAGKLLVQPPIGSVWHVHEFQAQPKLHPAVSLVTLVFAAVGGQAFYVAALVSFVHGEVDQMATQTLPAALWVYFAGYLLLFVSQLWGPVLYWSAVLRCAPSYGDSQIEHERDGYRLSVVAAHGAAGTAGAGMLGPLIIWVASQSSGWDGFSRFPFCTFYDIPAAHRVWVRPLLALTTLIVVLEAQILTAALMHIWARARRAGNPSRAFRPASTNMLALGDPISWQRLRKHVTKGLSHGRMV